MANSCVKHSCNKRSSGKLRSLLKVASLTPNAITPNDKTLTQYSYDSAQRLVAWERGGMGVSKDKNSELANWRFDPAGNRLPANSATKHQDKSDKKSQESDWSARVQQNLANPNFNLLEPDQNPSLRPEQRIERWQTNRVDFIDGITYTHDAYGNLVKLENQQNKEGKETTLYGYDGEHRLVWLQKTTTKAIQNAPQNTINSIATQASNTAAIANNSTTTQTTTTATYTYDALGRRLQKVVTSQNNLPTTTHYGYDGDRLVCTQTDASKVHTIYEPGSFVPLLRISQALEDDSPKTEAETTEAKARELLDLAAKHGKPAKEVNPDDLAKVAAKPPQQLPGFGTAQWAGLSKSFAHLAENGYPESMKALLRQAGLDPDKIVEQAKHAVSKQKAAQAAKLTIQMYHCNHLGTPIALINQDGWIDWAVELDPWGNVLNEFNPNKIDQPIRMQGQQIDRESGLFYNRHRYYDPNVGRYITQDPIGLAGGMNLYGYVTDPNGWIDPFGLAESDYSAVAGRDLTKDGPRYGNWCGGKWSGGVVGGVGTAPPVDSMDALCKAHDNCYDSGTPKLTCDVAMVKDMKELPKNPKKWPMPIQGDTVGQTNRFRNNLIILFDKK